MVRLTLRPAPSDHGIVFLRTDMGAVHIPARYDNVCGVTLSTTVGNRADVTVSTVEHLMAAFAGTGVDNALVEIDGPEVPILDGSAARFVFLLDQAGRRLLDAPRRALRILERVEVREGDRYAALLPGEGFHLDIAIAFAAPLIGQQRLRLGLLERNFRRDLCRARTFGFREQIDSLHAAGYALGGSLANAVLVDGERVLNAEGLRFPVEFVRHKALDMIGDLFLAGAWLIGTFESVGAGHSLHHRLLQRLFACPEAWCEAPAELPARYLSAAGPAPYRHVRPVRDAPHRPWLPPPGS
jgi:UDP-3-O-[3-hydroxymyristoyl] N-acetylglucosamine deacetylase